MVMWTVLLITISSGNDLIGYRINDNNTSLVSPCRKTGLNLADSVRLKNSKQDIYFILFLFFFF